MNINDQDLIETLLTSEFEDVQKKDDFKFLLFKFREFYRILHSRLRNKSSDLEFVKKNLEEKISLLEKEIFDLKVRNSDLQNKIDLTPKEKKSRFRFFGL
jgi:predicted  nucleic acid-binding Zn-ribbon protein